MLVLRSRVERSAAVAVCQLIVTVRGVERHRSVGCSPRHTTRWSYYNKYVPVMTTTGAVDGLRHLRGRCCRRLCRTVH